MRIVIGKGGFAGEAPRIDAQRLPDNAATLALNVDLRQGDLRPYQDVSAPMLTISAPGAIKTLYRYGKALATNTEFWWGLVDDASIVRGLVQGDNLERTYWTGADRPRCTDYPNALAGTPYPFASFAMGVPIPAAAIGASVTGTATPDTTPVNRFYREVFVSQWSTGLKEPSAPGPASGMVVVSPGQSVDLTLAATPPAGPYLITHRRIFRTDSGVSAAWRLVVELPISTDVFNDTVADEALGELLESDDWLPPPNTLQNLIALPNGIMAGTDGFDVLLTDPYRPYAWRARIPLGESPVGLGVTGGNLIALTKGKPYLLTGSDPTNYTAQDLSVAQACLWRRGIVDMRYGLCYPGPDGLVLATADGQAVIVTEANFTGEQWRALCQSMHAIRDGYRYVAFFESGGGFEIDPRNPQTTFVRHDIHARAAYVEPATNEVYICDTSNRVRKWRDGPIKPFTYRSKLFQSPHPTCFRVGQIDADAPVTVRVYADGALKMDRTVSPNVIWTLPGGFRARTWQIEIAGATNVRWAAIAHSAQELSDV